MHDWNIQIMSHIEFFLVITEFFEPGSQGVEEFEVVISLNSSIHDFFLQFRKWIGISGFVSFQKS